jgi:TonB-dependent SusC/RagA subfamily outer membrane receptor
MRRSIFLAASMIAAFASIAQTTSPSKVETRVIIRDGSGLSGEKPLVVIDGKPGGELESISPDQILKINVLKGNAAYDLYGAEGKNGVIMITTRSQSLADTVSPRQKKVERIVTVNTYRMKDGDRDTTIVRADSMTVNMDRDRVIINGMPLKEFMDQGMRMDTDVRVFKMNETRRALLGVSTEAADKGALVKEVMENSPAAKAGIQVNDRITQVGDEKIDGPEALVKVINDHQPGDKVMVTWTRGKKTFKQSIELAKPSVEDNVFEFRMPIDREIEGSDVMPRILMENLADGKLLWLDRDKDVGRSGTAKQGPRVGLSVQDAADGKGVQVMGVTPASAAAKAGIQTNDRILSIDEKIVSDVDELTRILETNRSKRSVMLHLQRGNKDMFVELVYPRELKKAEL